MCCSLHIETHKHDVNAHIFTDAETLSEHLLQSCSLYIILFGIVCYIITQSRLWRFLLLFGSLYTVRITSILIKLHRAIINEVL